VFGIDTDEAIEVIQGYLLDSLEWLRLSSNVLLPARAKGCFKEALMGCPTAILKHAFKLLEEDINSSLHSEAAYEAQIYYEALLNQIS
jgi:hypothetical protein